MLASNRACHAEAMEPRRHSVHKCKPSSGTGAESLACSISGNGRGLNRGAARGIQYSVATSFYQLDRKSFLGLAASLYMPMFGEVEATDGGGSHRSGFFAIPGSFGGRADCIQLGWAPASVATRSIMFCLYRALCEESLVPIRV